MENDNLPDVLNAPFPFTFNGQTYYVKKASLRKIAMYQQRVKQLASEGGGDPLVAAYCIFMVLKDHIPDLTEDFVLDNVGDVDVLDLLITLGFLTPEKLKMARRLQAGVGQTS